jgi:hypothetical protein
MMIFFYRLFQAKLKRGRKAGSSGDFQMVDRWWEMYTV